MSDADDKSSQSGVAEPDVLRYTNYRVFLRDWYDWRKLRSSAFSLRFFAQKAGLSSHAHLKLVMDGKRNATRTTVTKILIGLGFTGRKAEYFENLVFFNQASGEREKKLYFEKLLKASPNSKLRKLEKSQFRMFREWYHSTIREMVALADFRPNPETIARRLGGKVTPKEAADSLALLQELGLVSRTANGLRLTEAMLTTDDEVADLLVREYHRQMIARASAALSELPGDQRDISAVTFGIRRKDFAALKSHVQLMRKELLDFAAEPGQAEEVVQMNLQLFPLTR